LISTHLVLDAAESRLFSDADVVTLAGQMRGCGIKEVKGGDAACQSGEVLKTSRRRSAEIAAFNLRRFDLPGSDG